MNVAYFILFHPHSTPAALCMPSKINYFLNFVFVKKNNEFITCGLFTVSD
jgi:hypothetical protein